MSAPDTTVDSSPNFIESTSDTKDGIGNSLDHSRQAQTVRELARFVYDLVTNGPGNPNIGTRVELWDARSTINRVKDLLKADPNSIFDRLGTVLGHSGTTVRQVAEQECTFFEQNLPMDAVREFNLLVAEKLGVPLTEWYTVVDRNTGINIMCRTAQREREIVSRLWPTITNTAVMNEAFKSVRDNGKTPFSDYWDRKRFADKHEDMKNWYRIYARRSGLDVRDLSLVDTDPTLAPYILRARVRNQTVREAFPVPTWIASLPASERDFDNPFPTSNELEEIRNDTVPPGSTDSDSSVPP